MTAVLLIPWFRLEPIVVGVGDHELIVFPFQITVGTAFVLIVLVSVLFARGQGRSIEQALDLAIHGAVFALPCAVLFTALRNQPDTLQRVLQDPGRIGDLTLRWSSYGGMIGGFIGATIWKWRTKGSLLEVGDAFAFALPFGMIVARLGCFAVHDHPGRVSEFPLAVADYRTGMFPFQPRHDLGLYEALLAAVVAGGFLLLSRSRRTPGFYVGLVAVVYPIGRFLLDFLRAPRDEGGDARTLGLTLGQYVAAAVVVLGILVVRHVRQSVTRPG